MTIAYKLTEKGRTNLGTVGGHLDRMLKSLAAKKEMNLDELVAVVKRHSNGEPRSIASWYLSRAADMGWIKRELKEVKK